MTTTLARDASRDRKPSDPPERGGLPGIQVDQALKERIEELLRMVGDRSAQVTIGTRRSWCWQPQGQALSSYQPRHHDCERNHP